MSYLLQGAFEPSLNNELAIELSLMKWSACNLVPRVSHLNAFMRDPGNEVGVREVMNGS